jgi:cytochrome c553
MHRRLPPAATLRWFLGLALLLPGARHTVAQSAQTPAIVRVCAPCHGSDGEPGNVETPRLAGQSGIYLYNQLTAFRTGKRRHPEMKAVARDLTDREIEEIVLYYALLPPR